jgi:Na+/melibiose symporter-like transporter
VFAAALAFSGKATAGVGAIIGGFMLDEVVHWPARANPHTVGPHIVVELGIVAGIVVPLLLIIPLVMGFGYRITRERHAATRLELDRRRAALHTPPQDEAHLALELVVTPVGHPPLT